MNLLTDPLFRVQTYDGLHRMSLPALFAALGRDAVEALPGLQRHQEDAFHLFLCQLAGAILARRGETNPIQNSDYWSEALLGLSGDGGEDAWTLVVQDLSRPAFMQPPLPRSDWTRLKPVAWTPDALDLLPTAKNHDLKQARAARTDSDQWIYALVSLQTMSGYFGRGNPGISRMNGGHGSRAIVELVSTNRLGTRWREAVERLLVHRSQVLEGAWNFDPEGLVLIWLEPWDGNTSLPLDKLDPLYVEICRRIRLRQRGTTLWADTVPSNGNRIAAKELKGVVGDAWLPISLTDGSRSGIEEKALTISPQGLTAETLRRLVFSDGVRMGALQRPLKQWQGTIALAVSVLVRGQGTTDGFHERRVPIPPPAQRRLFGPTPDRDAFASLSRIAIDYAGKMGNRVLRPAVFTYLEGAPQKLQFDRESAKAWWTWCSKRFEARWSQDYFAWLWSVPEPFDELVVIRDWVAKLRDHALAVLRQTEAAMPVHAARRYRARVRAESRFWSALYSEENFGFLREGVYERAAGQ